MIEILIDIVFACIGIIIAMVLSAGALYSGIGILDNMTKGIDEWKLIKKGNVAVGVLYATVMASMIILIAPRILDIMFALSISMDLVPFLITLAVALFNYVLGLLISLGIIFLSINVIDKLTSDLEEFKELAKGNVAVALIMSIALLSIVYVVGGSMELLFGIIKSLEYAII